MSSHPGPGWRSTRVTAAASTPTCCSCCMISAHTAAERGIDYRLVAVPDLAVAGATSH